MKILFIDIETAPNLAYIWGMWGENIPLERLISPGYMLCWAAKWYGEDETRCVTKYAGKRGLKALWKLLDEADAVVHYNGKRFDIPHINREFLQAGLTPPSPYKQIDLLETVKRVFKFPSNKLGYVGPALGLGSKQDTGGFNTWIGCIKGDKGAWNTMTSYNIEDVKLLERLYDKLKPWIKGHANHSMLNETSERVCPRCGGTHHHKRGFTYTNASKFQRFQCKGCGGWFKDNTILNRKQYKTSEIV